MSSLFFRDEDIIITGVRLFLLFFLFFAFLSLGKKDQKRRRRVMSDDDERERKERVVVVVNDLTFFQQEIIIFEKTHKFSFCIKKTPQSITNNINKHRDI